MKKSQKPAVSFANQSIRTSLSYDNLKKLQNNVVKLLSHHTYQNNKNTEQMMEDFFVVAFEKFLNFNAQQGKKLNDESFILDGETVNMNYFAYLQSSELIANFANLCESPLQTYATKKINMLLLANEKIGTQKNEFSKNDSKKKIAKTLASQKNENPSFVPALNDVIQEITYDEKVMIEGRGDNAGTLVEVTQTKKISYIKDLDLFADSKELFFILVKYAKQAFFNDVKNKPQIKDIEDKKIFDKVSQNQNYTIDNDLLVHQTEKSIFEIFDIDEEESICEAFKYQIVLKTNNSSSVVCVPKNLKTSPTTKSVKKRLETYLKFFKVQLKQEGKSISIIEVREIPCDKYDNLLITENDKLEMLNSIM